MVSAVGHEVDFSIADFVADLRAPTPSAAAELVVRDRIELLDILRTLRYTMHESVEQVVTSLRERIQNLLSSYSFNKPRDLIRHSAQRVDELERTLQLTMSHLHEMTNGRHRALSQRLQALSPEGVLQRGYAMVRKEGKVITTAKNLREGDRANIQFHDGEVVTRVEK